MPIVLSRIVEDRTQVDGRRSVIEAHTDHVGVTQTVFYLAEPGANVVATMLARVPVLESQAAEAELAANEAEVLA